MLLPVLYNLSELLGVGNYNDTKDYSNDLGVGTGGININFHLLLTFDDRYVGTVNFDVTSSGSVEEIGITSITYEIERDGQRIAQYDNNFNPPRLSSQITHNTLQLQKDAEIICQGSVFVKFLIGAIEQEVAIVFEQRIIITTSSVEIEYTWDVAELWLQIFDYITIFALILLLANTIRHIRFEKHYTQDMRKHDEEFFENIRKNIEKENTL